VTDKSVTRVKATFRRERRRGRYRPVIHVLMPDGRVTEFKDRGIVIPEDTGDATADRVFALLINGNGEPYATSDGEPAIVAVPVVGVDLLPNPEKALSWRQVAQRAGVSLATAKRMSADGLLPKPTKVGLRKVVFWQGEVDAALRKKR
jgi:predicted DNA-binding transcriptional regulator AlpA